MLRIVPYTDLDFGTSQIADALFVELRDDDHYRRLLRALWERGDPFVLIEHDVVPRHEQLKALERCPEPWCGYGYGPGDWVPVFGCIRFSADLIAAIPDAFSDETWPWCQLDARFAQAARAHGFRWHWHWPHVHHARQPRPFNGEIVRGPETVDYRLAVAHAELVSIGAQHEGRPEGAHWYANVDLARLGQHGEVVLKET